MTAPPKAATLAVSVELAVMLAGSTVLTPLYDVYRRAFGSRSSRSRCG